jgi:hypothetical protein
MGILIGLNLVLAFLGYLLPIPSLVLAWREQLKMRGERPAKAWRRVVSQCGVLLLSIGIALWAYSILREAWLHDYSYMEMSAVVGRWGSLGLAIVCLFAERKLRRYLIIGAVGLLFFFGVSVGDVTI